MDTHLCVHLYVQVSDLKKELKSRGLSIGGNKSELYARLQAAVDSEKDDENDEDLLGEDILDEVLKNTEANNKPDSEADKLLDEAILATSSEESLTQTTKSDSDTTTQPKTKIRKLDTDTIIKSPETTTTRLKPKLTKTISPVINVETKDQTSDTSQSPEKADNPTGDAAKIVKASAIKILTAEERALLRAQKFGQVDKLKTRAERFGTEKAANNKIGKISKEVILTILIMINLPFKINFLGCGS